MNSLNSGCTILPVSALVIWVISEVRGALYALWGTNQTVGNISALCEPLSGSSVWWCS